MAALTTHAQNMLLDAMFRGQALSMPATLYVALVTVAGSSAGAGTEVTGGSYARVAVASSLANWSGTQGATTTAASSGTSGQISNNGLLTFPAPTASWGTVVGIELWDAATAGNRWAFGALETPQAVASGAAPPTFPISFIVLGVS